MKPIDVKSSTYTNVENNDKDSKFKFDDHVKILKYKDRFCNIPNWSEENSEVEKVKNIVPWTYKLKTLTIEKITENFMKKSCKRQSK